MTSSLAATSPDEAIPRPKTVRVSSGFALLRELISREVLARNPNTCIRAPNRYGGTGECRVFVTPSVPRAPPPLGEPWTCVTATRTRCLDRRTHSEVTKPPLRD